MSCGHCREAVTQEVAALEGVASVRVDLARGRATVRGDAVDDAVVAAAVAAAGYEVRP